MPSTDSTDGQLPDTREPPPGHRHDRSGSEWSLPRLEALRDRATSQHVVNLARAVSVGSVAVVIVITYLATPRGASEANPVTRVLIEDGGWAVAALISIGTTALVYELYARLATGFWRFPAVPLVAAVAALLVTAFNVVNLLNDLQVLFTIGFPRTVVTGELLWVVTITGGLALIDTLGRELIHRALVTWFPGHEQSHHEES